MNSQLMHLHTSSKIPDNLSIIRFLLRMVRKRKQLLLTTVIWPIQTQISFLHKVLKIKMDLIEQCAPSIPLSMGCETSPETGDESNCSVLTCSISSPKRHPVFCFGFKDCQIFLGLSVKESIISSEVLKPCY